MRVPITTFYALGANPGPASRVIVAGLCVLGGAAILVLGVSPKVRLTRRGSLSATTPHADRGPLSARLRTASDALVRAVGAWFLLVIATAFGLGGTAGAPRWSMILLMLLLLAGSAAWLVLRSAVRCAESREGRFENAVRIATGRTPRRQFLRPTEIGWLVSIALAAGLFVLVAMLELTVNALFPSEQSYTRDQISVLAIVLGCVLGGYVLASATTACLLVRRQRRRIAAENARLAADDEAAARPR